MGGGADPVLPETPFVTGRSANLRRSMVYGASVDAPGSSTLICTCRQGHRAQVPYLDYACWERTFLSKLSQVLHVSKPLTVSLNHLQSA